MRGKHAKRDPRTQGDALSEPAGLTADRRDARKPAAERLISYLSASWPWILLASAIVVLAGVLRFWNLGKEGLRFDEIWSVNASMYGPIAAIKTTAHDTNPPLFYVLEALAIELFGRSDTGVRIVPAVLGILSTAFMYLGGRKLFNRATALWAAALFAVSIIAVQFAQEARMYSQLMLFSAILMWVFARLLEKPSTARGIVVGVVVACLAYSHVFGYMVGPVLLASVLLIPRLRRRVGRQTVIACAAAAVLFLPWLFVLPAQIQYVRTRAATGGWWMQPPSSVWSDLANNVVLFSPAQPWLPTAVFIGLLILGAIALPKALAVADSRPAEEGVRESDIRYLLAALAIVPPLMGLLIAKYVTPVYTVRNTLVSLPAAYMLAAHGGVRLRKYVGHFALLLLVIFGVRSHPQLYKHTFKGEWLRAAEIVAARPDAGVLADSYSIAVNLETYPKLYDREGSPNVVYPIDLKAKVAEGSNTSLHENELPAFISRFDTVYVVSQAPQSEAADYMNGRPGWKLTNTENMYRPVVRTYTKVK